MNVKPSPDFQTATKVASTQDLSANQIEIIKKSESFNIIGDEVWAWKQDVIHKLLLDPKSQKIEWSKLLEKIKPELNEMFGYWNWHLWWNENDSILPESIKIAVYDNHKKWLALIYAHYEYGDLTTTIVPADKLFIEKSCCECDECLGVLEKPIYFEQIRKEYEDFCPTCGFHTRCKAEVMS